MQSKKCPQGKWPFKFFNVSLSEKKRARERDSRSHKGNERKSQSIKPSFESSRSIKQFLSFWHRFPSLCWTQQRPSVQLWLGHFSLNNGPVMLGLGDSIVVVVREKNNARGVSTANWRRQMHARTHTHTHDRVLTHGESDIKGKKERKKNIVPNLLARLWRNIFERLWMMTPLMLTFLKKVNFTFLKMRLVHEIWFSRIIAGKTSNYLARANSINFSAVKKELNGERERETYLSRG